MLIGLVSMSAHSETKRVKRAYLSKIGNGEIPSLDASVKMLMYEAMLGKRSARSSLSKGSGVTGVSLLESLSDKLQKVCWKRQRRS